MIPSSQTVSICLNESTDRSDTNKLVVFAKNVKGCLKISDKISGLFTLTSTTIWETSSS